MLLNEMIEQLQEMLEEYGDCEVRIGEQPRYPLENEISRIEIVNTSEKECETCDGEGNDGEKDCSECEGTGVVKNSSEDTGIVYILMGSQIGYMNGSTARQIGWGRS